MNQLLLNEDIPRGAKIDFEVDVKNPSNLAYTPPEPEEDCPQNIGYVYSGAFSDDPQVGNNSISKSANFRDMEGNKLSSVNCNTGKLIAGSSVYVVSDQTVKLQYPNGNVSSASYYKVSYANCPENNPKLPNYNPSKPCRDCNHGDPVLNPIIQKQLTICGTKGGMFGDTRGNALTHCTNRKYHGGVDIKTELGAPIYAMFSGKVTKAFKDNAGYYVGITSNVNGETVYTSYLHMKKDGRAESKSFVKAGDIIGYQGLSGNLAGAIRKKLTKTHVHINLRVNWVPVDPLLYFKTKIDTVTGEKIKSGCD